MDKDFLLTSRSRWVLWPKAMVVAVWVVAGYCTGGLTTAAAAQPPATSEPTVPRNSAAVPNTPMPARSPVVLPPPQPLPYSMESYAFLKEKFPSSDPTSVGPNRDDGLHALESILSDAMDSDLPYTQRELPQLLKDVIYGRVHAVMDAINAGAPVNQVIPFGENTARQPRVLSTLLSVAIDAGQREVVRVLLDRGASPNGLRLQVSSPNGSTQAVPSISGQRELVQTLLDRSAPLRLERFSSDSTLTLPFIAPLTLAASRGQDDVVQLLLERGADINAISVADSEGPEEERSALRAAAKVGRVSTTYLLLMRGADINSVLDPDGKLPSSLRNPTMIMDMAIRDMLVIHGLKVAPDDSSEVRGN